MQIGKALNNRLHKSDNQIKPRNMNLSDRLNRLSPSATLAMSQKSAELKAQGIDVINLSVGEPDFNTPAHIKEAAIQAIHDNYSRYSPVSGYPALREAIVRKLKNENGLDYTAAQISVSNGAKQSVCNAVMSLVNDGDEVIIPAPYWVSYPEMAKLAGGTPVFIEAGIEQDFKITPAQLEAAITPKTRLLILCSPSNPTGSVYSKAELEGLAQVLAKHERAAPTWHADSAIHQQQRGSPDGLPQLLTVPRQPRQALRKQTGRPYILLRILRNHAKYRDPNSVAGINPAPAGIPAKNEG